MFLIRGYQEDGELAGRAPAREPGTTFEVTVPVWRVAECLLHASRLADRLESESMRVLVRWEGLEGRQLVSFNQMEYFLPGTYVARSDAVTSTGTIEVATIRDTLPEVVNELVRTLYEVFDFFVPPENFCATQINRMLQG
jgi:hypothetical protein